MAFHNSSNIYSGKEKRLPGSHTVLRWGILQGAPAQHRRNAARKTRPGLAIVPREGRKKRKKENLDMTRNYQPLSQLGRNLKGGEEEKTFIYIGANTFEGRERGP